jgi:hypothetical protein
MYKFLVSSERATYPAHLTLFHLLTLATLHYEQCDITKLLSMWRFPVISSSIFVPYGICLCVSL